VEILEKPRNALIKQYQKIFYMDGVELEFTPPSIRAIAKLAKKRKTGARALRTILEEVMLEIMYEVPSLPSVKRVVIPDKLIGNKEETAIYEMVEDIKREVSA